MLKRKTETDRIIEKTNQLIGLFIIIAGVGVVLTLIGVCLYTNLK